MIIVNTAGLKWLAEILEFDQQYFITNYAKYLLIFSVS
jgi:hypothetical protein